MSESAGLEIVVSTKGVGDAERELNRLTNTSENAERATNKLSDSFGNAATAAGLIAGGIAGIGLTAVTAKIISATRESDAALAQLDATLKSMGPGVGYTSEQLQLMAKDLQSITTYGDDSIVAMQSVLATFGEIKGDQFKQASVAVLDMATKLGSDLKGAALQVGKALNDPTEGMNALRRAGVSFTDSQKEQIKTLQESGNLVGAQTLLLRELQREFGGSAEAARGTLGGALDSLNEAFNDLFELSSSGSQEFVNSIESITEVIQDPDFQEGLKTFANTSLAAIELLAAVMAGKLVSATISSTKQLVLKTAASIADLQAEKAKTAEALRAALANEALAKSELRLAANLVIGTDATAARAASLKAYNSAVAETVAAQKAAEVASARANIASGLLGGALRVLGGPAGIVATTALSFLLFRDNVSAANDETSDFEKTLKSVSSELVARYGGNLERVSNQIIFQEDAVRKLKKEISEKPKEGTRLIDLIFKDDDEEKLEEAVQKLTELKTLERQLSAQRNSSSGKNEPSVVEKAIYVRPEAVSTLQEAIRALEEERAQVGKNEIEVAKLNAENKIAELQRKLGKDASKEAIAEFEKEAQTLREVAVSTAAATVAQKEKEKADEKAKNDAKAIAQELESISQAMLSQEQVIKNSYQRRAQIIENAEGLNEIKRERLLAENNERMTKELDRLHADELERLSSGLRTEEDEIRASYERRRVDIINSEILTGDEKTSLLNQLFVTEQKALQEHHEKMLDYSRVYGGNQVSEYQAMVTAIQDVQGKSWDVQALTYSAVLEGLTREGAKHSRKMFELNKAAAIANAIVSTYTGAAKALELGPYIGPVMAALITIDGLAKVNTIRNTQFGGSSAGVNGGSGATMGAAGGGISPAPQQNQQGQQQSQGGVTIIVNGDIFGNDAQKLFDQFKEILGRGDQILIETTTTNGMALSGKAA